MAYLGRVEGDEPGHLDVGGILGLGSDDCLCVGAFP